MERSDTIDLLINEWLVLNLGNLLEIVDLRYIKQNNFVKKKKKNNLKFEQLLRIYWSRNFLYGGKTQSFRVNLDEFFFDKPGLNKFSINLFSKRFEVAHLLLLKNSQILFSDAFSLNQRKAINVFLSKIISINNNIFELKKLNQIRKYLIRTYRGRRLALGKPSRGQRTWSNARTAILCNKDIKVFIQDVKKFNSSKLKKKKESLSKKFFKTKVRKKAPKLKMIFTKKKKNIWF